MAGWFRLQWIRGDHLVQPTSQSRVTAWFCVSAKQVFEGKVQF